MRYLPVILGVVLIIYGLIDCIRSEPSDVRSIPKPAWILVILILPLIGVILWFLFGRPQYAPAASQGSARSGRAQQYLAPDDDPTFLRNLEVNRAHKAEAERLRKLKEELDARDARDTREEHPNDEPKH